MLAKRTASAKATANRKAVDLLEILFDMTAVIAHNLALREIPAYVTGVSAVAGPFLHLVPAVAQ
jgi:hypothetical protein